MKTTCAIIVKVHDKILACKTTNSLRYDLPKGIAEPDETHLMAALRELCEETGLEPPPGSVTDLCILPYNSEKMIHFFQCELEKVNIDELRCTSFFDFKGKPLPEVSGYAMMSIDEFMKVTSKSMQKALNLIQQKYDLSSPRHFV